MHTAEEGITVNAPISEVYRRWSDLTNFPSFMDTVKSVTKTGVNTYHWKTSVGPLTQEFDTTAEFNPERSISWQSIDGPSNAGAVTFTPEGTDQTRIEVRLQYEPDNAIAKAGATMTDQMDTDLQNALQKFKNQVEGTVSVR